MKNCFFIGHSDTPGYVQPLLNEAVEHHITEHGVIDFYVGHYGNFDRMAAHAVKEAKQKHPHIHLILVLPYHPAERPTEKPEGFDDTYYPWMEQCIPKRFAIIKTNQYIVDTCQYLISYVKHSWGGAAKTMEYARKKEKNGLIQISFEIPKDRLCFDAHLSIFLRSILNILDQISGKAEFTAISIHVPFCFLVS